MKNNNSFNPNSKPRFSKSKPVKSRRVITKVSSQDIYDGDDINIDWSIPSIKYSVEADYGYGDDGKTYTVIGYTTEEVDNPNYDTELAQYNDDLKEYRKNLELWNKQKQEYDRNIELQKEQTRRDMYEELKKIYEPKK